MDELLSALQNEQVAQAVVKANRKLFDAFADVGVDDLLQIATTAAWKSAESFNADGGSSRKTWAGTCARRRLIDYYRTKVSQRRCENVAIGRDVSYPMPKGGWCHNENNSTKFLTAMPASRNIRRAGRLGYQCESIARVMKRRSELGVGWRTIVRMLHADPELSREMGFRGHPPSLSTFRRFVPWIKAWANRMRRKEMHEQRLRQSLRQDDDRGDSDAPSLIHAEGDRCGVA